MRLDADAIKRRAREIGFDLCGVAPAGTFPELGFLAEWLRRGYAGEMAYMSRSAERRADVRRVLPGARSVIALGTLYNTVAPYSTDPPGPTALISRYAWGDDYHDVIARRMTALLDWMREESSEAFEARAYVDTGPVQERVYARHAGLGWIGKNTCLINPDLGSWLFLSEIICTLTLEPDTPALDQCGSCTRCLDECPTGALVGPGVLDSTRCISYLTIEVRGAIPEAAREGVGRHIYGCDICQDVCPYNQTAPVAADPVWHPRAGLDQVPLSQLWQRSDGELRTLTKGSAMKRAKLGGLRRNVAVAIGNTGDAHAVATLEHDGDDRASAADPMVMEHVRWAVERNAKGNRRRSK